MFLSKKLNKGAGTPVALDAQFNYVTMLLHGDGTNGAQNNTFIDSSSNNFTITRNGNTTQGSFSPYGSNWSNYFDQLSYFFVGTNSAYNFSSGSWTYECWINLSGTNTSTYYTVFTNGYPIQIYVTNNAFEAYIGTSNGSGGQIVNGQRTSAGSVPVGSWVHFALVRNSSNSTYKMYVNGVEQASTTSATDPVASTFNFTLPAFGPAPFGFTQPFLGYISNFRATASAVYTSNFTPSTTPLTAISGTGLLTCADNRFIDDSTNNFAISLGSGNPSVQRFNPFGTATAYSTSVIGGSGYFDGSGDNLRAPSNSAFTFGTGDYTIEAWVYARDSANNVIVEAGAFFGLYTGFLAYYESTGGLITSSIPVPLNAWTHVALSRSSGTLKLFVNGAVGASASVTTDLTSTSCAISYGAIYGGPGFNGYISNARVVKGTAVYTSAFTPPTAPVTAITNTSLLTNMTNGAIFDNAMMNNLETVGNAQISTSVVKYGTGSIYLDGTGDWLQIPAASPNVSFGTGDFTIEMWVYTSNLSNYQTLFDSRTANSTTPYGFFISNIGQPYWYDASGLSQATITVSSNTWTHIAVCRASGTLKIFVGGISGFSGSNTNSQNPAGVFTIGKNFDADALYIGYIDDFRITKGYARYTTTFTPPTAAFPNTGPV
jgi:hypothetical protein